MALETEDIKELTRLLRSSAGSTKGSLTDKDIKLAIKDVALKEQSIKLTALSNNQIKEMAKSLGKTKEEQKEWEKELKKGKEEFNELNDSIRSVRSSLRTFGKAAYTGTGSISDFTESLRGSSTILNFVADFGKTLDVNAETFRGLAEVGANFNQSVVSMRNAAASAALPLDDFAKLVRDNSTTLAALYGTTTKGAMGIAGLSEALRTDATPQLASLGFTVDEINDTLLTNLDRQRRSGTFDRMTNEQRVQSAKNFAMELDKLAKLTGQQRAELRKELEAQQSNARFAAFIRKQDDATSARLSAFAATVSGLSPLISEGLQDIIANAGRPVTEAGLQLVQNIPELQGTIQNLIAGTISSEQALMSMKDMSTKSLDRFSKAAVTGTVPFLDLTPGIVSLSTLTLDQVSAMKEQMNATAGGTSSLMRFQEASKRLSAATQSLETGFYSMLGALGGDETNNVVGAIGKMSDNFIKGTSDFTKAMLYGSKTLVGMGINLLRNTLPTYTAVYKGTLHGNLKAGGSGGGFLGGLGKKGKVGKLVKGGARVAGGLGRALPAIGAVTTTGMSIAGLLDDDKSNDVSSWTGLAGSVIGGLLGAFGGPAGAMIGMTLGNMAGSAVGGMFDGKQHGGPMIGGNPHLVGETGPEIVMTKANSNVLSNAESNRMFNTKNLETQLTALVAGQASANKFASQHLDSVNRGNMIAHKTSLDVAKSARQDRNAVGMI